MFDLETSTRSRPRPDLGCGAKHTHTHTHTHTHKMYIQINVSLFYSTHTSLSSSSNVFKANVCADVGFQAGRLCAHTQSLFPAAPSFIPLLYLGLYHRFSTFWGSVFLEL
jgi:hypothetical protein